MSSMEHSLGLNVQHSSGFSRLLPLWGGSGPPGGLSSHLVPYLGQSPEGGAGVYPPNQK